MAVGFKLVYNVCTVRKVYQSLIGNLFNVYNMYAVFSRMFPGCILGSISQNYIGLNCVVKISISGELLQHKTFITEPRYYGWNIQQF